MHLNSDSKTSNDNLLSFAIANWIRRISVESNSKKCFVELEVFHISTDVTCMFRWFLTCPYILWPCVPSINLGDLILLTFCCSYHSRDPQGNPTWFPSTPAAAVHNNWGWKRFLATRSHHPINVERRGTTEYKDAHQSIRPAPIVVVMSKAKCTALITKIIATLLESHPPPQVELLEVLACSPATRVRCCGEYMWLGGWLSKYSNNSIQGCGCKNRPPSWWFAIGRRQTAMPRIGRLSPQLPESDNNLLLVTSDY